MNTTMHDVPEAAGRVPLVEVVVVGEFDLSAVPRLSALFDEALTLRPLELVIDLAGCPFVDAAAIALLLETHRRARRAGGLLTLRSPSRRLRRNLRLARVDGVLHVTPPDDALAEANDSSPGCHHRPMVTSSEDVASWRSVV